MLGSCLIVKPVFNIHPLMEYSDNFYCVILDSVKYEMGLNFCSPITFANMFH